MFLFSNRSIGLCFDYGVNKEQPCASGMCYLYFSLLIMNGESRCVDDQVGMVTQLHLVSYITTEKNIYEKEAGEEGAGEQEADEEDEVTEMDYQIVERDLHVIFFCRANNCNNQKNGNLIINAVNDMYNLSAMYEVLKVKIKENSEESSTSTIGSTASTTVAPTATTTAAKSTIQSTTEQKHNTSTALHISMSIMIFIELLLIFHTFSF